MKQIFFVTGTDTGIGKTALTAFLARFLCGRGVNVAALKPICSGGRDDARTLQAALNKTLTLDEINPWPFPAPIAPLLAARRERRRVRLGDVLAFVRTMHKCFDLLLIEGAGGLLSPLGENFNSRDLLIALRAAPIIVCPNRLGAVNQVLLTLEALPENFRARARVVLMSPLNPDAATASNAKLLAEFFDAKRIFTLPWLGKRFEAGLALQNPKVGRMLRALVGI